jgi:hypothetical protein
MTIRSTLTRAIPAAAILAVAGAAYLGIIPNMAHAETASPSRQFVLISDAKHPEVSVYCVGSQKDDELHISAADASNCTIIAPAPAKAPIFTCHAVDGKGRVPISWECDAKAAD